MTTRDVIYKVAKENNTTPEIVEEEMRKAIRVAMATKDPHARALWKLIAPDGKEPSIEAVLQFCSEMVIDIMEGQS